jgi:hypothetical protein
MFAVESRSSLHVGSVRSLSRSCWNVSIGWCHTNEPVEATCIVFISTNDRDRTLRSFIVHVNIRCSSFVRNRTRFMTNNVAINRFDWFRFALDTSRLITNVVLVRRSSTSTRISMISSSTKNTNNRTEASTSIHFQIRIRVHWLVRVCFFSILLLFTLIWQWQRTPLFEWRTVDRRGERERETSIHDIDTAFVLYYDSTSSFLVINVDDIVFWIVVNKLVHSSRITRTELEQGRTETHRIRVVFQQRNYSR